MSHVLEAVDSSVNDVVGIALSAVALIIGVSLVVVLSACDELIMVITLS